MSRLFWPSIDRRVQPRRIVALWYGPDDGYLRIELDELALIGKLTGIPTRDVIDALRLQDEFFSPRSGSWFFSPRDEILCMKMVPGFIRGCGCFMRSSLLEMKEYTDRFPEMGTLLSKWHNAAYRTLEPELRVEEEEE